MRETELWRRLYKNLGESYAKTWCDQVYLAELDGTVSEALMAGKSCKIIWRAVWRYLELPDSEY